MCRFRFILFLIILGFSLNSLNQTIQQALEIEDYQQSASLLEEEVQNYPANIEAWRLLGFSYKRLGGLDSAISAYQKVLELSKTDYDAHLALGRLYLQTKQYEESAHEFSYIYTNDKTDVEALWGLARVAKFMEDYQASINYYNQALQYLPDHIPTLLELATVYSYADDLDEAISTYQTIIKTDDSWAEAWAGKGKMLWWKGLPYAAQINYQKALNLDSENEKYLSELHKVENELAWYSTCRFSIVEEREEDYTVTSWNQHYKLNKILSNHIDISLNSFWQYNQKERESGEKTIEKWFDNSYLKLNYNAADWISLNSTVGASINDTTTTTVDAGISLSYNWKKIKLRNNFNLGNEYFSHWEGLKRNYLSNNFTAKWKRIDFISSYKAGKVEKAPIWDGSTLSENPFLDYSFGFNYLLYKPLNLRAGAGTRFMDYEYQSNLYYTPADRLLISLNSSLYYSYKSLYVYASSLVEQDSDEKKGYNNEVELGYFKSGWSVSASYGNFKNPWYESDSVSLTVSGRF